MRIATLFISYLDGDSETVSVLSYPGSDEEDIMATAARDLKVHGLLRLIRVNPDEPEDRLQMIVLAAAVRGIALLGVSDV